MLLKLCGIQPPNLEMLNCFVHDLYYILSLRLWRLIAHLALYITLRYTIGRSEEGIATILHLQCQM
jgi:hypothetical protein